MGGLGLITSTVLAIASKIFYVYVDPKIIAVEDALPGANCGGCGLPGCSANAEAIVSGKAEPFSCVAGGSDLAFEIAGIWLRANGNKNPRYIQRRLFSGDHVAQPEPFYHVFTLNCLDHRIPQKFDFGVGKGSLLENAGGTQFLAPMYHRNFGSKFGKVKGFIDGGIATTSHSYRQVSI